MSLSSAFAKTIPESQTDAHWYQRARQQYGLLYGALAGLTFALAAWGADALGLAGANGMLPGMKLLPGTIASIPLGALAGWLAMKSDRGVVSAVLWGLAGAAFGWLAGHIPFEGATVLAGWMKPELRPLVDYPFSAGPQARLALTLLATVSLAILAGLLIGFFIEGSLTAMTPFGRWWPVALWIVIFAAAGTVTDSIVNQPLREPVLVMDDLIRFALEHEGQPIDRKVALDLHLGALNPIRDLLHRPRKLILQSYDETLVSVNILIDFGGTWVRCSVNNYQPGFCQRLS